MLVNSYDNKTGEYLGRVGTVKDPLTGEVLYNTYTTPTGVPDLNVNKAALYLTTEGAVPRNWGKGEWYIVSDFRGEIAWKKSDGSQVIISSFGDISAEYTQTDPSEFMLPAWEKSDASQITFSTFVELSEAYTRLDPSEFIHPIWSEGIWINDTVQQKEYNANKAKNQQNAIVSEYAANIAKKALGLEVVEADLVELQEYVQTLEADINNPSSDQTYHPPLPPGVVVEDIPVINITMTRPEGWNNTLGWKMVFDITDPEYIPANIAVSVYTLDACTEYLYTPGALQQDAETGEYYAMCPAGQEKGDIDYHFGLLYGSAQLACWTFTEGTQEETKQIYGGV